MKIDTTARILAASQSGKSFEVQLSEAQASGRSFGVVVDMRLGKQVIYHTAEELALTAAMVAETAARPKVKTLEERVAQLESAAARA